MEATMIKKQNSRPKAHKGIFLTIKKDLSMHKFLYILALPIVAYYIIFSYVPMYGILIAFKDYAPLRGILGSDWIGLENFTDLLKDRLFSRAVRNTVLLNVYGLLWGFPAPIILALLINELSGKWFKRTIQTGNLSAAFYIDYGDCGHDRGLLLHRWYF